MRKHYIDNLRWMILLVLIPYHTAMAWNIWNEPNYITLDGNRAISSIVVFFSPYFMRLLFVLAGISTKFALMKRTKKEYLSERVKRLLMPLLFGTIVLMPVMTYTADKFNFSYNGNFFEHYKVFFTKYTDLTGADGGFSLGQFWFLLFLLIVSALGIGLISLLEKTVCKSERTISFWLVIVLGLPLPLLGELLSIGGKSIIEFLYLFLLGYFVFSEEEVINKAEKYRFILTGIGITATVLNVYFFIWLGKGSSLCDSISRYFMILALIGLAKRYLDFSGKVSVYMSRRSFVFYIWHYIWVVLFQYLLCRYFGNNTVVLFACTVIFSYVMTFICCEITVRIPLLCFLTGTKYKSRKE